MDYWQDLRAAFGLHQRLTEAMEDNYAALERLRPGTVRWLDAEGEVPGLTVAETLCREGSRRDRYAVALLDGGRTSSRGPTSEDASSAQSGQ